MVVFGLIMVYSSSFIYAQERTGDGFAFIKKQILFAVLGFVALGVATRIDYRKWSEWAYPVLAFATLLLAMVMIPGIGSRAGGAQRWIRLGFMNFQPGELAKFALIIFASKQLERKRSRLHEFRPGFLSHFIVPLPALALLLAQPDFGSTVMIMTVLLILMFQAGVPKKFLFSAVGLAVSGAVALALGSSYRRARVMTFLDPWSDPGGKGFQILQSLVGLHNGHIFGVGLGNGKEKLFYLPEAHNDFIFAVVGEELGFVGVTCVAFAFLYFVYRGMRVAWTCYEKFQDFSGMLMATGITLLLGLQGFVNMSVVLGLVPTKGLTLPFMSYGGSALLVDLFAIGILLSISRGPQVRGALSYQGKESSNT